MSPPARTVAGAGLAVLAAILVLNGPPRIMRAADHADGFFPGSDLFERRDANITNFFAFRVPEGDRLVLCLLLNSGIEDPGYFFAEDLTLEFHIDHDSKVRFNDDPDSTIDDWMMRFGGTVSEVDKINEDIVFKVRFDQFANGTEPKVVVEGLPAHVMESISVFPAPGESPLVRGGAALVLEMPLALVTNQLDAANPLLLWVTSNVPEINGLQADHMGMPDTSNQPGNRIINALRPRHQSQYILERPADVPLGAPLAPYADVLIYNTARDAEDFPLARPNPPLFNPFDPTTRFPNGRPIPLALRSDPFDFPYLAR